MPTTEIKVYPPEDLLEQTEQYAAEHDLSLSAAWQDLARRGLQGKIADEELHDDNND